ncbi:TPA: restriction endonuclease subunit S [Streptococcus suis]|nr:restriction endonuclease subunit S [Streptococcus suis]MBL6583825.1 restriction endonuclease subunit S [Streptococcus suis]MBS8074722.1 restriction endonuclease subunit S [Streptococcus suis]MBS8087877.1 restriction endonuclease subunit S [Streptococcus suis]MCB2854473.1 restriction endonuclease subunit S [Streptococcus suis]MCB2878105.1 restriction endonuclease subunit S [Streptococcus suis]
MTKEKSTVPRLRFPGFTDAWKQRKLGEVAEKISQKNLDRQYVETFTNSAEFGIISQRDFFEKNISSLDNISGYYIVNPDDFVYNPRISNLAPVGPIKRNKLGRVGVMSPLYTIFRFSDIHLDFVEKYFDTTIWHRYMELNGDSGARSDRFAIKDSVFKGLPIPLPTLPEQEAIGSFFSDLDQLITLHQRKLDDVKELKKALLQKMFPKGNGNDFPELRFPEFTDAWKQRKLGEVADFSIKTNSLSRDKLSSYFYEVQNIHYGDILTKYDAILDVCNKELPSIIGSTISDFADALLSEGDIVFADAAEDSTVGKAIEVRNFKGKNVVSGLHTIVARPKVSYAPYYLGYLINSTAYHNQILPLMQGTKVSSISKANLKSTTVVFPTLPEQEAIGSFFSDLDQLITLHQRQLDHLKLLKKALLQQMFI